MVDQGLIMDDGEVRECPTNKVKLGYWKSFRLFYSYKRSVLAVDWSEAVEAVLLLLNAILFVLLLPVLPFVQCWFDLRSARKEVKAEETRLKDRQHG